MRPRHWQRRRCPNCGLHVMIPTGATDACVTAIAEQVRDNLPVGRLVYPEFANEHWNNAISVDIINCYALASLFSTGTAGVAVNNASGFYALRLKQIHDLFIAAFNAEDVNGNTNRGDSIVCIFCGQATAGLINAYIQFANTSAALTPSVPVRIDAIEVAPYLDAPQDTTFATAAAASYSNYPGSLQYKTATPLSIGQYVDLFRHFVFFYSRRLYRRSARGDRRQLRPGPGPDGQPDPDVLLRRRLRLWCHARNATDPSLAPILLTMSFITRTSPMRRSRFISRFSKPGGTW